MIVNPNRKQMIELDYETEYLYGVNVTHNDIYLTRQQLKDIIDKANNTLIKMEEDNFDVEKANKEFKEKVHNDMLLNEKDDLNDIESIKKKKSRKTKVYVMIDRHTGLYKIGVSDSPAKREHTLCSIVPKIDLLFSFDSDYYTEKQLHNEYSEKRTRGEWFKLTKKDIRDIKKQYNVRSNNSTTR